MMKRAHSSRRKNSRHQITRNAAATNHADDTSFTLNASRREYVSNLVEMLNKFNVVWGLCINWRKSNAYWHSPRPKPDSLEGLNWTWASEEGEWRRVNQISCYTIQLGHVSGHYWLLPTSKDWKEAHVLVDSKFVPLWKSHNCRSGIIINLVVFCIGMGGFEEDTPKNKNHALQLFMVGQRI